MDRERVIASVECRASATGPRLHATIIQEGRAATGGLREVFAPMSVLWPPDGISIRTVHLGAEAGRAIPMRETNGEIRIEAPATPEVFAAVNAGKRFASVEFHALEARETRGGVREINRALVEAVSLTDNPEYDTTRAELREKARRRFFW